MTGANRSWVLGCAALMLAGACGWEDWDKSKTPPTASVPAGVDEPVVLSTALAFLDRASGVVFLVDAQAGKPRVRAVEICRNPVKAVADSVADRLLVLCVGVLGGGGVAAEAASLWIVPAAMGQAPTRLGLSARFNELAQSPDGRFVIAYFAPGGASSLAADSIFNPNQLAIVDLSLPTPAAVTKSIRSMADVPRQIFFSPALWLPEGARVLAFVGSQNYVTILDPSRPERTEITVPLTLIDDPRRLEVRQILFDPGSPAGQSRAAIDPMVYLRASGTQDVFALRLSEVPVAERLPGRNDFLPSLSQLAAGREPVDMALYAAVDTGGTTVRNRLLVVNGTNEAILIDADSSRAQVLPLEHAARHVLVWEGPSPGETVSRPRAFLFSTAGGVERATFADLHRIEELRTRNLSPIRLSPIAAFLPRIEQGLILVQHQSAAISVIRLHERGVLPLQLSFSIQALRSFATLPERMWVLGDTRLAYLNLSDFSAGDVLLDARVTNLLVAPPLSGAGPIALAVHPGREGYVTAVPALAPTRAGARSLRGFAADGLDRRLDRALPNEEGAQ